MSELLFDLTPHLHSCLASECNLERQMCLHFTVPGLPSLRVVAPNNTEGNCHPGKMNDIFMINPDLGNQSQREDSHLNSVCGAVFYHMSGFVGIQSHIPWPPCSGASTRRAVGMWSFGHMVALHA